jgi:hypothetical protein
MHALRAFLKENTVSNHEDLRFAPVNDVTADMAGGGQMEAIASLANADHSRRDIHSAYPKMMSNERRGAARGRPRRRTKIHDSVQAGMQRFWEHFENQFPLLKGVVGGDERGYINRHAIMLAELGWAAGIVDGEGCILIVQQRYRNPRRKVTHRPRLTISQNNRGLLDHFRSLFPDCNHVLAQVKRTTKQNRDPYSLTYDGKHAVGVLMELLPYLERKRYEAEVLLEAWTECRMGKRGRYNRLTPDLLKKRDDYMHRLRRMK